MNVLLINKYIEEKDIFLNSVNEETKYIFYDRLIDTYQSILDNITALGNLENIKNIALITHGVKSKGEYNFLENESPMTFKRTRKVEDETKRTIYEGWNEFITFLKNVKTNLVHLENFDFLGCALLKYRTWKKVLKYIETETGINVRASDDDTGNLKVGADWVLESDNVNIKDFYFTELIENLTIILGTPNPDVNLQASKYFQYNKNGGTIVITGQDGISFSLEKNGNPISGGDTSGNRLECNKIILENDLIIDGSSSTFDPSGNNTISLKGNITFDGQGNNLILNNCSDWIGFIQTDSETFENRPIIKNLDISGSSTDLTNVSGYGSAYLLKYNSLYFELDNCSNSLDINDNNNGGLIPSYEDVENNKGIIKNCYNTGDINDDCGGICATYSKNITITNCYNTGDINDEGAGGIFGYESYENTITNCYNTGDINDDEAGGIFGYESYENTITNCYNTGDINGGDAGGIFGEGSYENTITNCYNTGDINGEEAGGILGKNSDNNTLINCYTFSNILGNECGGFFGADSDGIINIINSFSFIKNDTSGTSNTSLCYRCANDSKLLLYNVKSNNQEYMKDASNTTLNPTIIISGSTELSVDSSNNGIGSDSLKTNTANQIAELFKNKENVNSWILNPKGSQYANPENNFLKQERKQIPGTNNYFPILASNNLKVKGARRVIKTYENVEYTFSNINNVRVKNGSIIIERIPAGGKPKRKVILFNNRTGCKKIIKCGKGVTYKNGSFDTIYNTGREIDESTNAKTQASNGPETINGIDITLNFTV